MDYGRVLEYSLKVLRWRSGDIKALYRAGVASLQLGDAQTARHYLIQASRGKPNGKNKPHPLPIFIFHQPAPGVARALLGVTKLSLGELIDFVEFSLSNYTYYDINRCLAEKKIERAVGRSLTAFCLMQCAKSS